MQQAIFSPLKRIRLHKEIRGAIHSTKISQKFRSKTQWIGSVQPEKFRKFRSTFWGGPLFLFTLLHSRFVKPPDWIWELFKKIILTTGRDQETVKWEKKEFYSSAKHAWFARWHSIDSIYLSIILKYKLRQLSYFVLILNKLWFLWRYVTSLWFVF